MGTARPCRNAIIAVGANTLSGIIDASVTLSNEAIEVTEIAALSRGYIGGVRSATADGSIFYDQDDAACGALEQAVISGSLVTFTWTWAASQVYSATGVVTSFSPSIAVNDIVKASFSIQLNAVTIT